MRRVFLGLGSNFDRANRLRAAWLKLQNYFAGLRTSSVYDAVAIGGHGGDCSHYYNMVVEVQTDLTLEHMQRLCKYIEKEAGRSSDAACQNIALDIDILLYDDLICEQPLSLPSPAIVRYAYVLRPLAELAPNVEHPVVHHTFMKLWQSFTDKQSQPTLIVASCLNEL